MGKARRIKNQRRQQMPAVKPYLLPKGMQAGDLVVIDKDGNVIPCSPEVLGDDWPTIRKKLAGIDRRRLFALGDLARIDDTEH
jgi:hypothetical protein